MKRLFIALTVLSMGLDAAAALPASTDPTLINVPQLAGGFFVGLSGNYLQPTATNGDLDYATTLSAGNTQNISTSNIGLYAVQPGYNWGWGADLGYTFAGTANDITASYFHLGTKDINSVLPADAFLPVIQNGSGFAFLATPFTNPVLGVNPSVVAAGLAAQEGLGNIISRGNLITSKAEYTINRVDLAVGQSVDVGCRLALHGTLGATWTQLKRRLTTAANGSVVNAINDEALPFQKISVNELTEANSKFNGVGPLMGLDASYYLVYGMGVVAHTDAALLIGNINTDGNITATSYFINTFNGEHINTSAVSGFPATLNSTNIRRIVPVLDTKVGLNYTFLFNNARHSNLTLEAGWQLSDYFNAVDMISTSATSNLGLSGPYVSLVFHA